MARIAFDADGVSLRLTKEEYWGVIGALNWTTAGRSPSDHDFRAVIMAPRDLVERLEAEIGAAELDAREAGSHWAPLTTSREEHQREWNELLDRSRTASRDSAARRAQLRDPDGPRPEVD